MGRDGDTDQIGGRTLDPGMGCGVSIQPATSGG